MHNVQVNMQKDENESRAYNVFLLVDVSRWLNNKFIYFGVKDEKKRILYG